MKHKLLEMVQDNVLCQKHGKQSIIEYENKALTPGDYHNNFFWLKPLKYALG